MYPLVWRVVPRAVPVWAIHCSRCSAPGLDCTGRFRVNSNGSTHDVWLLYACPACRVVRKRSIHRRVRENADLPLERYRRNDAAAAALWAFALSRGRPVPYRVDRPALANPVIHSIRIDQPYPCGVRWDVLLAGELGVSRNRIRAAWESGAIRVSPPTRPGGRVGDGQRLELRLDEKGRSAGRT